MPQVSQQSPITTLTLENALLAIPTHAGIGMQRRASRPVWRYASNSRRDRTQNISIETHNRHEMSAKRGDRTSTPDKLIPRTPIPNYAFRIAPSPREPKPARCSAATAHNLLSYKAEYHFFAPARTDAALFANILLRQPRKSPLYKR